MLAPQQFQRRIGATGAVALLAILVFFGALVYWQVFRTDLANANGNPVNLESAYRYNASLAASSILGTGFPFVAGKSEYFPIPQSQIDLSQGKLKQNSGY